MEQPRRRVLEDITPAEPWTLSSVRTGLRWGPASQPPCSPAGEPSNSPGGSRAGRKSEAASPPGPLSPDSRAGPETSATWGPKFFQAPGPQPSGAGVGRKAAPGSSGLPALAGKLTGARTKGGCAAGHVRPYQGLHVAGAPGGNALSAALLPPAAPHDHQAGPARARAPGGGTCP